MTLWIMIRKWIKKYVFLYLFSGTLPYRGEMRLCVIYPIPLSMLFTQSNRFTPVSLSNLFDYVNSKQVLNTNSTLDE